MFFKELEIYHNKKLLLLLIFDISYRSEGKKIYC